MSVKLDKTMNNLENGLSHVSAYPVIGTLAGATKVVMGATQSLTAVVCGLCSIIPALVTKDWTHANRSWTHVKHGMGNIVAGAVESIPGVQTIVYIIRKHAGDSHSDSKARLYTNHENKFMPYKSLIERDFTIDGCNADEVNRVKAIYNTKINEAFRLRGDVPLTAKEKYKLAKEAVNGE